MLIHSALLDWPQCREEQSHSTTWVTSTFWSWPWTSRSGEHWQSVELCAEMAQVEQRAYTLRLVMLNNTLDYQTNGCNGLSGNVLSV